MNAQRPSNLDWPFDVLKLVVTLVALVGVLVLLGGRPTPGQTAGPVPTATPGVGAIPTATDTPAAIAQLPTDTPATEPTPVADTTATPAEPTAEPTVEVEATTTETAPTTEPTGAPTAEAVEPTATPQPVATETVAAEPTADPTATPTPTAEPVLQAEDTPLPAATATPVPPTDTPASPPAPQAEPTATPSDPFALRIIIPEPGRSLSSQAQVFTGTGPADEVVILLDEAERILGKTTIRSDGSWRIIIEQSNLLPIGEHTIRAGVIDKAGVVVMSSEPVVVTVTAP